jgi:phosphonoacetaldehyde hydrolase
MAKLTAAVFDWAGTMVDFGSRAPMGVFVEAFAKFGVPLTIAQARGPMGMAKRDHIKTLMAIPSVAADWVQAQGAPADDAAIDRIYDVFVPMNVAVAGQFAGLIPGVLQTITALRARGMKIGSTTGYTRSIMAEVLPRAAEQGLTPDNLVCAGDLAEGRPSPLMMYRCFADLGVYPPHGVVKIDDTEPGIVEGLAAGCWTVGLSVTGNAMGLSEAEWASLPSPEQAARRGKAEALLRGAGAHYVIDGVADLIPVIDAIEARLAGGERP